MPSQLPVALWSWILDAPLVPPELCLPVFCLLHFLVPSQCHHTHKGCRRAGTGDQALETALELEATWHRGPGHSSPHAHLAPVGRWICWPALPVCQLAHSAHGWHLGHAHGPPALLLQACSWQGRADGPSSSHVAASWLGCAQCLGIPGLASMGGGWQDGFLGWAVGTNSREEAPGPVLAAPLNVQGSWPEGMGDQTGLPTVVIRTLLWNQASSTRLSGLLVLFTALTSGDRSHCCA